MKMSTPQLSLPMAKQPFLFEKYIFHRMGGALLDLHSIVTSLVSKPCSGSTVLLLDLTLALVITNSLSTTFTLCSLSLFGLS